MAPLTQVPKCDQLPNIFIGILIFLSACTVRSTTIYKKDAFPQKEYLKSLIEKDLNIGEYCLDPEKVKKLLDSEKIIKKDAFENSNWEEAKGIIEKFVKDREKDCGKNNDEFIDRLIKDIKKDNEGLFCADKSKKKIKAEDFFCEQCALAETGTARDYDEAAQIQFTCPLGIISAALESPGALSMSVRPLPSEQEPGGTFANMKERTQASLIDFAREVVKTKEKKAAPAEEAKGLLDVLSPTADPRFIGTRRFELTISNVLNSASVDDRFDYITAYLKIPSKPFNTNGGILLEREFLKNLKIKIYGKLKPDRHKEKILKDFMHCAYSSLEVKIEIVDPLKTEASLISLGKLTTTQDLTVSAGKASTENFVANIAGKIGSSREDTIAKELAKRSFYIDPDRRRLRITQRGMAEGNISGSFSSAVTLKIPTTALNVIKFEMDKEKEKVTNLDIKNIVQPLFARVRGFGEVLGTVRIAIPYNYESYRKEADGVAYTVVEELVPLNLWENDRTLCILQKKDLTPKGSEFLGIYTMAEDKDYAHFEDIDSIKNFIFAFKKTKFLVLDVESEVESKDPKGFWLAIFPFPPLSKSEINKIKKERNEKFEQECQELLKDKIEKTKKNLQGKHKPGVRDIWLGIEEEKSGDITPFGNNLKKDFASYLDENRRKEEIDRICRDTKEEIKWTAEVTSPPKNGPGNKLK